MSNNLAGQYGYLCCFAHTNKCGFAQSIVNQTADPEMAFAWQSRHVFMLSISSLIKRCSHLAASNTDYNGKMKCTWIRGYQATVTTAQFNKLTVAILKKDIAIMINPFDVREKWARRFIDTVMNVAFDLVQIHRMNYFNRIVWIHGFVNWSSKLAALQKTNKKTRNNAPNNVWKKMPWLHLPKYPPMWDWLYSLVAYWYCYGCDEEKKPHTNKIIFFVITNANKIKIMCKFTLVRDHFRPFWSLHIQGIANRSYSVGLESFARIPYDMIGSMLYKSKSCPAYGKRNNMCPIFHSLMSKKKRPQLKITLNYKK